MLKVKDIMTTDVISVTPQTEIVHAAKLVRIQKVVDIPGMKLREGLTSHIFLSGLLCNSQRAILFPS